MPLIQSGSRKAIGSNISEMVHAGHPQKQAVAAAMRIADKYASGGAVHEGFLHSPVPGRTDKLPIDVAGGSYILPADHVAALGQGNSIAGADIVNRMFKMGPYGASRAGRFAEGGAAGAPVSIIAAGGEIAIPPDKIAEKFGSIDGGHKKLDQWVVNTRKKNVKTLRGLKPPKKD